MGRLKTILKFLLYIAFFPFFIIYWALKSQTRKLAKAIAILIGLFLLPFWVVIVFAIFTPSEYSKPIEEEVLQEIPSLNPTTEPTEVPTPVSSPTSTPAPSPTPKLKLTPTPKPSPEVKPAKTTNCFIKGNISSNDEKIYHLPECPSYDKTKINENKGERWFCTEEEAIAAGWRKAKNCP